MSEEKKFYPPNQAEAGQVSYSESDTGRADYGGYIDELDNAEERNKVILAKAQKDGVSLEGVGEELTSLLDSAKQLLEPLRAFGARLVMRYQEYKAENKAIRDAYEERLAAAEKMKADEEEMRRQMFATGEEMKRLREEIVEMAEREMEGVTKEVINELERDFKPGADFEAKLAAAQTIPEKIAIIRQGLRESGLEPGEPTDRDSITDDQELKNRLYRAAHVVYKNIHPSRTSPDQNADDGADDASSAARGSHLKLI